MRMRTYGICFAYISSKETWVHVCSPKRMSPKGLSPHNIPGGQDPKPEWGPGPKV